MTKSCGFLNFLAGFFLFRMAGLADADDEGALCRFDHVVGEVFGVERTRCSGSWLSPCAPGD